jgi:hypothetical protein
MTTAWMKSMRPLEDVLKLVRSGVWSPEEAVLLVGFRPGAGGARQFRTASADAESRAVQPLQAIVADPATVAATVAKRARNPYGDFVFVGRAVTSDIVVDDPSVSKSHAAFRRDAGEPRRWFVKDNRSRNGTYVDGHRLEAGEWVPIRSGAQITFGGVAAYFVDPAGLAQLG